MKTLALGLGIVAAAGVLGAGGTLVHVSAGRGIRDIALTASDWTFTQDGVAELVQSPARSQLAWEVPGYFAQDGSNPIYGELFIRPTGGKLLQPDFQFDTPWSTDDPKANASTEMFAYGSQTGSGYGVPAYFYSPHGTSDSAGSAGQFLTGGNGISLGPGMSWLLGPAPYANAISGNTALDSFDSAGAHGDGPVTIDAGNGDWTVTTGTASVVMFNNMPIWHWADSHLDSAGNDLTGDLYLNTNGLNTYNMEFVSSNGAIYDANQWGLGFTNFYYDPGAGGAGGAGGQVTDTLQTPFGPLNMSWLSWLFTPPAYSANTPDGAAGVLTQLLGDDALGNAFEFGVTHGGGITTAPADTAGTAADVLNTGI